VAIIWGLSGHINRVVRHGMGINNMLVGMDSNEREDLLKDDGVWGIVLQLSCNTCRKVHSRRRDIQEHAQR